MEKLNKIQYKRIMKKTALIMNLLILLTFSNAAAEYIPLDSLRKKIKKNTGREKVDLLLDVSGRLVYYSLQNSLDSAREALLISQRIQYKEGEAKSYYLMGTCVRQLGGNDRSISYLTKSLSIFTQEEDYEWMIKCNIELGLLYHEMQKYEKAVSYYFIAFELSKKVESYAGKGLSYFALGNIYRSIKDEWTAVGYLRNSIENYFLAKDSAKAANSLLILGATYHTLVKEGNYHNKNTAVKHFNRALDIYENSNDLFGISNVLRFRGAYWIDVNEPEKAKNDLLLAVEYAKRDKNRRLAADSYTLLAFYSYKHNNYKMMLEYNEKALALRLKIGYLAMISSSYNNIGSTYFKLKDYSKALEYLNLSLKHARESDSKYYILKNYERISLINEVKGNLKKALEYQKKYAALKDSIREQELNLDIMGLRLKSDLSKREKEIADLEYQQQEALVYFLVIGSVLFLGFIFVLYKRVSDKNKDNKLLKEQKEKLSHTLDELNENREELRILNEQLEERVEERTGELMKEMKDKESVQEMLDSTSRLLNKMSSMAPMIAYINDMNTKEIIWQNKSLLKELGYEKNEDQHSGFNLNNVFSMMHPDDLAKRKEKKDVLVKDGIEELDFRLKAADGSWRWFLSKHVPFQVEKDGSVSQILGVALDITERKKIQNLLEQSEQRYRLITQNTIDIIWTADFEYNVTYISPSVYNFLGYKPFELLGKPFWNCAAENKKSGLIKEISGHVALIEAGENPSNTFSMEITQYHKNGAEIPSEFVISLMKSGAGGDIGFVGITRNITDRKKAEENLKKLNEELEKANRTIENALNREKELNLMKSRFIQMISHEYRTPLTVILSSAELINVYLQKGNFEKAEEYTKKIVSSVDLMTHLIDDVFTFSKFESGNLEINRVIVELIDFSRKISDEVSILDNENHKFEILKNVPELRVMTDYNYLRQIFLHLLMNAVKFSAHQSKISIALERTGEKAYIRIKDEGKGITEEEKENLFKAFHRGKEDIGIVPGIGLGLAMVKKFVDALEWEISFDSSIGEGTEFVIKIPERHIVE